MPKSAFLLDVTVKATVMLAAGYLLAWVMRRSSSSARYFTWTCILAAVLALPVLSRLLPGWSLPSSTSNFTPEVTVSQAPLAPPTGSGPEAASARAPRFKQWPAMIWFAGFLIALARLLAGHLRLALSLRRAEIVGSADWMAERDWAASQIGLRRPIPLLRSTAADVPLACGLLAPRVVLPDACDEWDARRRRIVLLHELTHARRMDPLLWCMAQFVGALYWFHPLAWLAASRFRREQERSCDDAVLGAGTAPSEYATHLVDLARSAGPAFTLAAPGMARASDLEQRVRALLEPGRNRTALRRSAGLASVAALLAALLPMASLHAQASGNDASFSGSVLDPSGAAVPRALILLKNGSGHQDAARTDDAGEYKFTIPAGSYTLQVRAPGFAEFQKTITLPAGDKMNITLGVGPVSEAVEVVGKAIAPAQTGTPRRIRVGGNVQATKLVSMTKPAYPPGPQAAGIEGTVLLQAVISTDGDLLNLSVLNTLVDSELAHAAMEAVGRWRYQPTLLNGQPVEVATTIAVTFRLEK